MSAAVRASRRTGERGQVLVLMAVATGVLLLMAGLVIDGGLAWAKRREAQNAADFAALAATRLITASLKGTTVRNSDVYATIVRVADANNQAVLSALGSAAGPVYVDSVFNSLGPVTNDNGLVPAAARGVRIPEARTSWKPFFLGMMGITSWDASAAATASARFGAADICALCVVGGTPPGPPLSLSGGQTFLTVNNGAIGANTGLTLSSNANLNATGTGAAINVYGAVSLCPNCHPQPAIAALSTRFADPLAFLPDPSYPSGSIIAPVSAAGPGTVVTLNPGVYGSITVSANATLQLNPGTYYLTGDVSIQSNGTLTGSGVTLVFMGPQTSFLPQSNATVTLAAPLPNSAATYSGMAMYFARNNTGTMQLQSSSTTAITGTIYAVNSAARLDMQSGTTATTLNSMVVVASVSMQASAKLAVSYDASRNVQVPAGPALLVQ